MSKIPVILRADGNSRMGLGHIYRAMALAEMLKDEFECTFIVNRPEPFILDEIKKRGANPVPIDKEPLFKAAADGGKQEIPFDLGEFLTGNEIVVTDGYLFGRNYQMAVKERGSGLVCIDDLADTDFFADIVINHAPGIDPASYRIKPGSQLLTGLNYAIIRKPFLKPLANRTPETSRNAFISVGGTDYYGYTEKILALLSGSRQFDTYHILCSSFFDPSLLERLERKSYESGSVRLYFNIDADHLATVLDNCAYAFVSASTILIESFARGLKCFVGYYVNNQRFSYEGFTGNGLGAGLGEFQFLNKKVLDDAIRRQDEIKNIHEPLSSDQRILRAFRELAKTCV